MSKMEENKDYELVPSPTDSTVWHVRILSGNYIETVVRFGAISFNEIKDHFSYNFDIIETPDYGLTKDDENLHFVLTRILEDIIERGEQEGWVKLKEKEIPGKNVN